MPYYEFECPKGHVTTEIVPLRDAAVKTWPCSVCIATAKSMDDLTLAKRILSATRTTFVFADTGKRIKHIKKVASKE